MTRNEIIDTAMYKAGELLALLDALKQHVPQDTVHGDVLLLQREKVEQIMEDLPTFRQRSGDGR